MGYLTIRIFFTNKEEGNSDKLVNRKHAEVDNDF